MKKSVIKKVKTFLQISFIFLVGLSFIALSSWVSSTLDAKIMEDACRQAIVEACKNTGGCIVNLK